MTTDNLSAEGLEILQMVMLIGGYIMAALIGTFVCWVIYGHKVDPEDDPQYRKLVDARARRDSILTP